MFPVDAAEEQEEQAEEETAPVKPVATLICVPGAGVAGAAAAAGTNDRSGGPGLWSTKKLLQKHGADVATTEPYHCWAEQHGVVALTLSNNSPDAIVSALTACSGAVLIAAHSEGGKNLIEVALKRASDLQFLRQRGVRVVGAALLDSVHKGPLPLAGEEDALLTPAATLSFVCSSKPLGDLQPKPWVENGVMHGTQTRSAGTSEHLLVPHAASQHVFGHFETQLQAVGSHAIPPQREYQGISERLLALSSLLTRRRMRIWRPPHLLRRSRRKSQLRLQRLLQRKPRRPRRLRISGRYGKSRRSRRDGV